MQFKERNKNVGLDVLFGFLRPSRFTAISIIPSWDYHHLSIIFLVGIAASQLVLAPVLQHSYTAAIVIAHCRSAHITCLLTTFSRHPFVHKTSIMPAWSSLRQLPQPHLSYTPLFLSFSATWLAASESSGELSEHSLFPLPPRDSDSVGLGGAC